jgi:hypothetical protein
MILRARAILSLRMTLDTESPEGVFEAVTKYGWLLPHMVSMESSPHTPLPSWTPPPGGEANPDGIGGHWLNFAWDLRLLRALVRHWRAGERGDSLSDAWAAEGFDVLAPNDMWPPELYPVVALPWLRFGHAINLGLSGFCVRANIQFEFLPGTPDIGSTENRQVTLYEAACLQLWNLMADGIPIKDCANDRCSNSFGHQYDDTKRTQHRSRGVLYCSQRCARAQAERERRRRIRAEQAEGKS